MVITQFPQLNPLSQKKFPAYSGPRKPQPGEATGPVINTMERERYIPTQHSTTRVGLAVYQ